MTDQVQRIKAISHPLRMEILKIIRASDHAVPIKEVAERLEQPAAKLHYHFRQLEGADFLEVTQTREINGITERYYSLKESADLDLELSIKDNPDAVAASLPFFENRAREMFHRLFLELPPKMAKIQVGKGPAIYGTIKEFFMARQDAKAAKEAIEAFMDGKQTQLPTMSSDETDGDAYELMLVLVPKLKDDKNKS